MRRLLSLAVISLIACGKQASPPASTPPTKAEPTTAPATTAPATTEPVTTAPAATDAATPSAEEVAAAPSEPDAATAPEQPPVEAKVDPLEAAALALVDTWLKAQNEASFERYAALYAPRFTGIKRSGPREKKYGHDRWLADRQRMFKSAMQVSVADVAVELVSNTAVVTFVQTWASGSYQDVGPKMLVLVPGKAGLLIAREEMLASEVQGTSGDAKPIDAKQFTFVVTVGEEHWVMVPTPDEADFDAWATGAPKLVQKLDPTVVVHAIDATKLDAGLAAWNGKKVADGECTGTIDRLELVGRYTPHFGVVQGWEGTDEEPPRNALTDAEVAVSAWESSGLDVFLAGHVSGCASHWTHDADQPQRPVFSNDATDPELAKKAITAFRGLAGWKSIQADAATYDPPVASPWDTFEGAAPTVAVWSDEAKTHTFVHVSASAGNGCGSFGGSLGALFELKGKDLVLMSDPEGGPTETIVDVVDIDGDGDVEFVLEQGLVQRVGPIWKTTIDITPPNYDCPC